MQNCVKQDRMQPEPACLCCSALRQRRLDEQLVAAAPHRTQAAKRRPVLVPACSQFRIDRSNIDQFRTLWWPLAHIWVGYLVLAGCEHALCVAHPCPVHAITVEPRVDSHGPFTGLIRCTDDDLQCKGVVFSEDEGRFQDELLYPGPPCAVACVQRQLHHRSTGHEHDTVDPVIGQPGVGGQRQPPCENEAI